MIEYRCQKCGHWVVTLPERLPWVRGRCMNKACEWHRQTKIIFAPNQREERELHLARA